MSRQCRTSIALALGLALAPIARADDPPADPPSRVGRIALLQGTVSFHPSPNDQWGAAAVNYPVAQSTALWTDESARAELEIGESRVRLDADTELDVVQLDDHTVVLSVPQGRVDVTLGKLSADERYEIQTPRGDVDLDSNGSYRLVAGTPQAPTKVAAFVGQAVLVEQNNQTIVAGQEATSGTGDPPTYQLAQADQDDFDRWSAERDHRPVPHGHPTDVPPIPGVAALDEYGTWHQDATYGDVWAPAAVAPGWAPYHEGHWAFINPWGYTWVDDAPWGFAPFHYGRWIQLGGAWNWVPFERGVGPVAFEGIEPPYYPVYSPAMVSFVGDPGALVVGGIGVGIGIGWFPLGPGELWHPWYPYSDRYLIGANYTNVNRTTITNIHNTTIINNNRPFLNQHATTVVPAKSFSGGESVHNTALKTDPEKLHQPIGVAHPAGDHGGVNLPKPEAGASVTGGSHAAKAPPAPALHITRPPAALANRATAHPGVATPHPVMSGPGFHPPAATANRGGAPEHVEHAAGHPGAPLGHPAGGPSHTAEPAHGVPSHEAHPEHAAPRESAPAPHPASAPHAPAPPSHTAPTAVPHPSAPAAPHPAAAPAPHPAAQPHPQPQQHSSGGDDRRRNGN